MSHRLSGGFIRYKHDTFQQTFGCEYLIYVNNSIIFFSAVQVPFQFFSFNMQSFNMQSIRTIQDKEYYLAHFMQASFFLDYQGVQAESKNIGSNHKTGLGHVFC